MIEDIPEEVIKALSAETAAQYNVIPFKMERKRLHVAMIDLGNVSILDELRFHTGYDIVPHAASEIRLLYGLEKYYGLKRDVRYISLFEREAKEEQVDETEEINRVKEAFTQVNSKGEIGGILTNESIKVVSRVGLFVIKGGNVEGWTGKGLAVQGFSTEIDPASVFGEVISRKNFYRGPILSIPANKPLLDLLHGSPNDALIVPVEIRDRTICLLYGDNGNENVLSANLKYLHMLVKMASLAFEILILKKRIKDVK
jgi:hypothetical protein